MHLVSLGTLVGKESTRAWQHHLVSYYKLTSLGLPAKGRIVILHLGLLLPHYITTELGYLSAPNPKTFVSMRTNVPLT